MSIFQVNTMDRPHAYANFALFGAAWLHKHRDAHYSSNPFNDPDFSEARKCELAALLGVDWIYGGWMEDRSVIWSDTYLKDTGAFLHLGIDLTVPAGTPINTIVAGEIIHIDTDTPLNGGWGGHVVQRFIYRDKVCALIYAHLGTIHVATKAILGKGSAIGVVGDKNENGHWSPHLHVQIITDIEHVADWRQFLSAEMDGYGKISDLAYWSRRCPDPTTLLFS